MSDLRTLLRVAVGLAVLAYTICPLRAGGEADEHAAVMFFEQHIRPLLVERCVKCHGPKEQKAGLRLDLRAYAMAGSKSGPVIVPGKPEESLLIQAVRYRGPKMPPDGKLPDAKISLLEKWIRMGAPWPDDGSRLSERPGARDGRAHDAIVSAREHWAFRPVSRPRVPDVFGGRVYGPVDSFILNRLKGAGLKPAPEADRRTLIRRLYFDLLGLPPSYELVQEVLTDPRPDAVDRLVDRLLASPHYGERWGRHWLDLVRFAQTNGYERDAEKPEAWRYRDYVIRSFNEDKPYDRFVIEQLAGDELPDASPETIIATGFYRLGVWDDEPDDKLVALAEEFDDIVRTTSETFLGLTLGCARCHEHKFDPFPQEDYYSFLAFFSNIAPYGRDTSYTHWAANPDAIFVPLVSSEEFRRWRQRQEQLRAQLDAVTRSINELRNRVRTELVEERRAELTPEERALLERSAEQLGEVEEARRRRLEAKLRVDDKAVQAELKKRYPDRFKELDEERKKLEAELKRLPFDRALAVREREQDPEPTYVFRRGNPRSKGNRVEPRGPQVFGGEVLTAQPLVAETVSEYRRILLELGVPASSGRRLALARWIASPSNPLTARVIANRVWQFHFGKGIVRTPGDFGMAGLPPTHPELLDWLATRLVDSGWSLKRLHREIVLSATYRQSSSHYDPVAATRDPDNSLWWRFEARRLEAEVIRDAILAVAGTLNTKMGGRGFFPTLGPEVLATQSRPGAGWGKSSPAEEARRSVYIYVKRTLGVPFLELFDFPKPERPVAQRAITTIAPQALTLLNSRFVETQAREFARFLLDDRQYCNGSPDRLDFGPLVVRAYRRALQREPEAHELTVLCRFLATQHDRWRQVLEASSGDGRVSEFEVDMRVAADLAKVLFNLNEFVYLE